MSSLFLSKIATMSKPYMLPLLAVKQETKSAVSLTFDVPASLKDVFAFKAGQYLSLQTEIEGQLIRRAYSLCSAPHEALWQVAIKEVSGGVFSSFANQKLTSNQSLEVFPPEGRFVFENNPNKAQSIVCFAAGSGITPILSIIKTALHDSLNKVVLVYGNKTPNDRLFSEDIQQLQNLYSDRFVVYDVFSQSNQENSLFGRIEASTVGYVLKNMHAQESFDAFYLCGPEGMIATVEKALLESAVEEAIIHKEFFSTVSDGAQNNTAFDGNCSVSVVVDDETFSFEMRGKKTLLEAALSEKIDVPYSCQGGVCCSCIGRLKSGNVVMDNNQILTESELDEGLILACQSRPTTSNIVVDFDDV